jgi:hypothetical protein
MKPKSAHENEIQNQTRKGHLHPIGGCGGVIDLSGTAGGGAAGRSKEKTLLNNHNTKVRKDGNKN